MNQNRIIAALSVIIVLLVLSHLLGMTRTHQTADSQEQAKVVAASAVLVPARTSAPGRANSTNDRVVLYIVREDGTFTVR